MAVPAAPALKVTPDGRAPDSENVGVAVPVAATANVPAVPAVKVVNAAEVITNGAVVTAKVNSWVAVPALLAALSVMWKVPSLAVVRVPPKVAVPLPLSTKLTPAGNAPDSDNAGVGVPVAITMNDAGCPTVNVVEVAELNAGGAVTVNVNAWVVVPPVLVAENVKS